MHAALFNLDLGVRLASSERARRGRSLAAALAILPGFVAFIAIEADDGTTTGLCICVNLDALEIARQHVQEWQRHAGENHTAAPDQLQTEPTFEVQDAASPIPIEVLASGEVIVQRGF